MIFFIFLEEWCKFAATEQFYFHSFLEVLWAWRWDSSCTRCTIKALYGHLRSRVSIFLIRVIILEEILNVPLLMWLNIGEILSYLVRLLRQNAIRVIKMDFHYLFNCFLNFIFILFLALLSYSGQLCYLHV